MSEQDEASALAPAIRARDIAARWVPHLVQCASEASCCCGQDELSRAILDGLLKAREEATREAEAKGRDGASADIREDEDAACRLEELRVKFGLPDGTPEEIAGGIGLILDVQRDVFAEGKAEGAREALERACKAICGPCADGWEVQCGRAVPPDLWYHPTQADRGAQVCHAGPIRALIPAPTLEESK